MDVCMCVQRDACRVMPGRIRSVILRGQPLRLYMDGRPLVPLVASRMLILLEMLWSSSGPLLLWLLVTGLLVLCASTLLSFNGTIFRITGPLLGESTDDLWIPLTKASDTGFDASLIYALTNGCYSPVKIAFATICACKNNRRIWFHNASA